MGIMTQETVERARRHHRKAIARRKRDQLAGRRRTIARIQRGVHGEIRARGVEHALSLEGGELRTLCGIAYDQVGHRPKREWQYSHAPSGKPTDLGFCEAPLTGEVTCKRCLQIIDSWQEPNA